MGKNSKIRFGLAGCGRISKVHTSVIAQLQGAELAAVCDIDKDRARAYADRLGCRCYYNIGDMLECDDIDIIDICTPTHLHADMVIASAKAGKHVISEKPMAITLKDADAMIETCARHGVRLFVVKQNRYNPPILKLKEALNEGRFGKLFYGNTTVFWHRDQAYYDEHEWFRHRHKGGGVLINQATHNVDMLLWLMGPVSSVYAKIATQTHDIATEDIGLAILKFKNGAMGTIEATTSVFPRNLEGSVTIFGENGSAKVGGIQMNEMKIWEFRDFTSEDNVYSRYSTNPPNVYGFGHMKFMEDVVKVLEGQKVAYIDGFEGKVSLEVILAIYESADTGREVLMSEFRKKHGKRRAKKNK